MGAGSLASDVYFFSFDFERKSKAEFCYFMFFMLQIAVISKQNYGWVKVQVNVAKKNGKDFNGLL